MKRYLLCAVICITVVGLPGLLGAAEKAPAAAPAAAPAPAPAAAPAPAKPLPPPVLKVGDPLPAISFPDGVTGSTVTVDKGAISKSRRTVLTFMNTACKACQQEIALLSKVVEKNPDVQVFAIAVDMRGKDAVAAYEKRFDFKVTFLLDPEFTLPPQFGFNYTPALVVADKDGKILGLKAGFRPGPDDDEIIAMLK